MHSQTLNLVVNCTARKTVLASPATCLGNTKGRDVASKAANWIHALASVDRDHKIEAGKLYCGDAWSILLNTRDRQDIDVDLWIVSAGHGLINSRDLVAPYSATFSIGHADSVGGKDGKITSNDWWNTVSTIAKAIGRRPASLSELGTIRKHSSFLVAISPPYLNAIREDLLALRDALGESDQLTIVSAGSKKTGPLADNFLPCDARFEHLVGGARASLNARIVRHVVESNSFANLNASHLKSRYRNLLNSQRAPNSWNRGALSDDAIYRFLADELIAEPGTSHTKLLRKLRDSGHACEQKRFRNLYKFLTGQAN